MRLFDIKTIEKIMFTDHKAIRDTIIHGHWEGCSLPGTEEWNTAEYPGRYLSMAVHYFSGRYPSASRILIAMAANLVAGFATGLWEGEEIGDDPQYRKIQDLLLAMAGGSPAFPGDVFYTPPPVDADGKVLLAGTPAKFTETALQVVEHFLFGEEEEAFRIGLKFFSAGNARAARAEEHFTRVFSWHYARCLSAPECGNCGKAALEHFFTNKRQGLHLCPSCFERNGHYKKDGIGVK